MSGQRHRPLPKPPPPPAPNAVDAVGDPAPESVSEVAESLVGGMPSASTIAVVGLFLLALFTVLHIASDLFLPIVLALLLNLLLGPIVRGLTRLRIPEPLGAALVMISLVGGIGYGAYSLSGPATAWMQTAPQTFLRLEYKLRDVLRPVQEVQEATKKVEDITKSPEEKAAPAAPAPQQGGGLTGRLFSGAWQVAAGLVVTTILLYFLLASGELFLLKTIQVAPRLQDKKRVLEIARSLEKDLSSYLLTVTLINIGLGVAVSLAMAFAGMPNPVLWGVLAAVLNFIPYLGSMVTLAVIALVAMLSFQTVSQMFLPPLLFVALTTLEGNFLTPMIVGRRLTLNPVMIFLSLLLWGWIWGPLGALLSVPLLATLKIICDNIPSLRSLGAFLGTREG